MKAVHYCIISELRNFILNTVVFSPKLSYLNSCVSPTFYYIIFYYCHNFPQNDLLSLLCLAAFSCKAVHAIENLCTYTALQILLASYQFPSICLDGIFCRLHLKLLKACLTVFLVFHLTMKYCEHILCTKSQRNSSFHR